jgi:Holliday junction resolvasome RuvABC endonuclease subunit
MMRRLCWIFGLAALTALGADTNAPTSGSAGSDAKREGLSTTIIDPETRELKPRDSFRFAIEQDPAQGTDADVVTVTDGGEAMFPVSFHNKTCVKVNVAGKKLASIREEVKKLLDAEYYQDAAIHLDFMQANRDTASLAAAHGEVTFFGALVGRVPLPDTGTLTLSDAVLKVGQNDFANLRRVKVHRLDKFTKVESIHEYNVKDMLDTGERRNDPVLQEGDRIEVPEKGILFKLT